MESNCENLQIVGWAKILNFSKFVVFVRKKYQCSQMRTYEPVSGTNKVTQIICNH